VDGRREAKGDRIGANEERGGKGRKGERENGKK